MDAAFGGVEREHKEVGALGREPVLVVVEADEQHPAVRRQRPGGGVGGEQREGDDVADELVDAGAGGGGLQREHAVALGGDLTQGLADV